MGGGGHFPPPFKDGGLQRQFFMNKEKFLHQFNCWILAWIELINAILKIITFTMWYPGLDFKYLAWYTKKEMEKRMNIR